MDRKERLRGRAALEQAIRAGVEAGLSEAWSALPAYVKSFDANAVTCQAQPTIQAQIRQPDGTWVWTTMPLCVDCPVLFGGGGGWQSTFPLAANDEGLLIFADRCIDSWWQSGGIQTQAELRMHDLSDGFFFPSGRLSKKTQLVGGVNANGPEIRSLDGKNVLHIDSSAAFISLNNGAVVVRADEANNYSELSAGSGVVAIKANGTDEKAEITAPSGLWVNGIMVTVP